MQLFNAKHKYLTCSRLIKGYGFMHKCLSPQFLPSAGGTLTCASCGEVYKNQEELKRLNAERYTQTAY